jgi:hypothetical protein
MAAINAMRTTTKTMRTARNVSGSDVRQAIAGAYEAGAPKQDENDRSSRDRQLREARWF